MVEVVYTNSNCSDVFIPFYGQKKKHSLFPLCVISDYTPKTDLDVKLFVYGNDEPYYSVWIEALNRFNEEYFIYLQEDFYLYNDIDTTKILNYKKILSESDYSFVRLLKSGRVLGDKKIGENLYEIESSNLDIFSMQATIWKTKDYIKIMEAVKENKWLEIDRYKEEMIKLNMRGLYHYDGERKRGGNHWDSNVYPYIATAIVRGKWNIREYSEYLQPLAKEYKIDLNKRGLFL